MQPPSRGLVRSVFTMLVLVLVSAPAARADPSGDLAPILDRLDDLYRGRSSHGTMTMHVVTPVATRDLEVEQWSSAPDKVLMRILSPEKEKGISTLVRGSNAWSYFPKVNQVTKLSASMLGASWMGSHLTNEEIVKRSRLSRDYTASKAFEGDRDGLAIVVITCDAKPDAPVVWGRIVVTVRQSDKLPTEVRYFDEAKNLVQTVAFSDVKTLGKHVLPTTMRFVNVDKPDEYTEVKWKTLDFDVATTDAVFSLRALQK